MRLSCAPPLLLPPRRGGGGGVTGGVAGLRIGALYRGCFGSAAGASVIRHVTSVVVYLSAGILSKDTDLGWYLVLGAPASVSS